MFQKRPFLRQPNQTIICRISKITMIDASLTKIASKFISYMLLSALLFTSATAQTKDTNVDKNLYFRALSAALLKSEEIAKSLKDREYLDSLASVIVEKDSFINENFPNLIEKSKVEYLDLTQMSERFKIKKDRFRVLVIRPMVNNNEGFSIDITKYWFSVMKYKPLKVYQSYEGGITVTFQYDCRAKDFVISKVEPWGY